MKAKKPHGKKHNTSELKREDRAAQRADLKKPKMTSRKAKVLK